MADIKISELTAVSSLNNGDLVEVSQVNELAPSGYTSLKASMADIGKKVNTDIEYTTDLADFTNKTTLGAIKETAKGKNIADEYDDTQTYNKGDVVIYKNTLYICTTNNITGTFDPSKWTATTIDNIIGSLSTLTTTDKSSLVGAVNEVDGKANKANATMNTIKVKNGSPAEISGVGAYASMIIMGFCQGIGAVAVLVMVDGNTIGSVINLKNGQAFSNANLTFSYSNVTQKITVSSTNASESSYAYIIGGIRY